MTTENEAFLEAWKRQVDTAMKIVDAMVEAGAKLRAAQLAAATETHQRTCAAEKLLVEAKNAQDLWDAQSRWAIDNCGRAAAYWRSLFEAVTDANARILACVQEPLRNLTKAAGDQLAVASQPARQEEPQQRV